MNGRGGAHLANQIDGGLHLAQLIGLSIEQIQDAAGQSADLIGHAGQWLRGELLSFLQSLQVVLAWLFEEKC